MESSHYTCRINGAQVGGPYESISAAKRAASRLAHRHDAPVEVSEMLIHQGHAIESIPGGYRVLPYGETFHDLEEARHWIDEHVRHEVRALERRQNPRRKNGPTYDRPHYPFAEKEAQYRRYSMSQLYSALNDAMETSRAQQGWNEAGSNWYLDDYHTIAKEIRSRQMRQNPGCRGSDGGFVPTPSCRGEQLGAHLRVELDHKGEKKPFYLQSKHGSKEAAQRAATKLRRQKTNRETSVRVVRFPTPTGDEYGVYRRCGTRGTRC